MQKFLRCRAIGLAFIVAIAAACDTGSKSKTPADIAADSALRADLALANRDTLLVDSIGRSVPVEGALADTTIADTPKVKTESAVPAPTAPVAPNPVPVVRNPVPVTRAREPVVRKLPPVVRPPVARRTSGNPCESPVRADQRACLSSQLAAADKRLNGIYRALTTEMRRKGGSSEAAVAKLRTSQRAWLANRDAECRKRGAGKEGALWAYPRVHCLAQFSDQRANELANDFSQLTSH